MNALTKPLAKVAVGVGLTLGLMSISSVGQAATVTYNLVKKVTLPT